MNGAEREEQPVRQPTPEWDKVRQTEEYPHHVIPVRVIGPIGAWNLPAKRAAIYAVAYDQLSFIATPNEVVPADPRIKKAWITCSGTNAVIGTHEQVTKPGTPLGFPLPQNIPMPWEGFEEPLYAVASSAGSGTISVRLEFWAD